MSKINFEIVEDWTKADDAGEYLTAHVRLLGADFHLNAIQVKDPDGMIAVGTGTDELDNLLIASNNNGNATVRINRKRYVVWMHPFEL